MPLRKIFWFMYVIFWVFPRRLIIEIPKKITHKIQNTAKVWNQEFFDLFFQ
jgi:hypothetical protein